MQIGNQNPSETETQTQMKICVRLNIYTYRDAIFLAVSPATIPANLYKECTDVTIMRICRISYWMFDLENYCVNRAERLCEVSFITTIFHVTNRHIALI